MGDSSIEARRLDLLKSLQILDSAPEALFDSLALAASELCGTPIALLSLVDADRQWFKACVGLHGVKETPRNVAFCDHAIRRDSLLEVPDALLDARFATNPLVLGDPHVRFYAGAPLIMSGGERIGTLCVIDHTARQLSAHQSAMLVHLARVAVQALEMRRSTIEQCAAVASARSQAVAESEARLRAILDVQADLVAQATADGVILYANPAYASFFGRSVATIVGTNLYDYVDPADREVVRERIQWVLETGEPLSSENRMLGHVSDERWIAWTNTRQLARDGTVLLHSTGRDVSARRRAEQELRASKSLLARTSRVAGVGGWSMDIDTKEVRWSEETCRIHDVPPSFRPTLENAISFYAPDSRPIIERAVEEGLATGKGWDLKLQLRTAAGRHIWARAVGEVEFEDGHAKRLVGTFQDITEQHALQEAVANSERFLRQLTDSLPVRIAYLDRERRYRFVNREWCRLAGKSRDEVIGRTRAELFPDRDDRSLAERAAAALKGECQQFEFDEVMHTGVHRFENRLIPDRDDAGDIVGFFVTGIDITARSNAEGSLRRVAAILENSTDYVVQADHRGRMLYLNPAARQALDLPPGMPSETLSLLDFMPEATHAAYLEQMLPALKSGQVWVGRTTVRLAQRHEVPVSVMVIAHIDADGRLERYSAVMRNIAAEVVAQQEAARQAATLRSVADAIPATVAVVGMDGRYRFVNPAFAAYVGSSEGQIIGASAAAVLGEAEFDRRRPWISMALEGRKVSFEVERVTETGKTCTALDYIPLRLASGEVDGFVSIGQDITPRKREEARLRLLSQTDPLTGLLNRAGFFERLNNLLGEEVGEPIAILCIDLDRFKTVNDSLGHAAGDELLRQLAGRLTRLVRPSDAIARLGGDEFAVLLPGMRDIEHAERVGRQIVECASASFTLHGHGEVVIGASVGGALGTATRENWQQMTAMADALLYRAKHAGRGQFIVERWTPATAPDRDAKDLTAGERLHHASLVSADPAAGRDAG